MKYLLVNILLLVAANTHSGTINIEDHLAYVHPTESGFSLTYENDSNPLSTCNDGKRFNIALSHPNYDALVSTVLAAHFGNRKVRIYVDDSQPPSCAPLIQSLLVRKN